MARAKKEARRKIPLTSFTLLTVPEGSMLSEYLKDMDTIDIRLLEKDFSSHTTDSRSRPVSHLSKTPSRDQLSTNHGAKDVQASDFQLELELDKYMAAITATESPNAVVRTIAASKSF
ncbi:uncharacterized protein Z518_00997 [Rhinocladiella mackenziei CBS 650.93]|uniref:Rhinocladiella mackenziei CBS 650.93 unplaced genomic scaffold supercont1.1, whole genome shotgun sequence n=1 Tax=Rhinocladiella mackenziei CBS 650.93 TaxID=1442369 RepID=A0A0D2J2K2_9EURO|nr:uncharacterized protein Z518_00997 [Rhinocladiella mackenziei CBS 650.93]KIX09916.1 hypothetical protein Z518_00997 [Rhinocladiella mackenziei CBS 650.93]